MTDLEDPARQDPERPDCAELRLLIQADQDGELAPAEAARVAAHLAGCPSCAALPAALAGLSARLADAAPYHGASAALRARLGARLAAAAPPAASEGRRRRPRWRWPSLGAGFAAGFALAAALALVVVVPQAGLPTDAPAEAVLAAHLRALQPGHLLDVVSTDQHTVKPWFAGRLDFSPPVKDLAAAGFPLLGGRLDYLSGRPVAALVYGRRQHRIDLYVWPSTGADQPPVQTASQGYTTLHWSSGGMTFWAISDVAATDLADFVRSWRAD